MLALFVAAPHALIQAPICTCFIEIHSLVVQVFFVPPRVLIVKLKLILKRKINHEVNTLWKLKLNLQIT